MVQTASWVFVHGVVLSFGARNEVDQSGGWDFPSTWNPSNSPTRNDPRSSAMQVWWVSLVAFDVCNVSQIFW